MRTVAVRAVGVLAAASLLAGAIPSLPAGAVIESGAAPPAAAAADAGTAAAADDLVGDIVFSRPSGTFQGEISVGLSTSVAGAQIRYSTNGDLPTASSPAYSGTPLRLTATTQLRAQAFVNGAASGRPGTALYVANTVTTTHDLPLLLIDGYGGGKPGRDYVDGATMLFEPVGGTTSLNATPTLATRSGYHLRGQSSATFPKAPYRLELWDNDDDDADYPVLGMPADSDWVLRGPYPDKALIRDAFMYGLGREIGKKAPRFAFVEFYHNVDSGPVSAADYQGVYLIVETIKNSKNRLDLKKLDEDDTTLPAISGGYIWKFDWMAAEEPILPCTGPAATCWNYLELVDPDPNPQQRAWITQHIQAFHDNLHSANFADPQTGYRSYIDVRSFIDQMILNELSREMDSYVRSTHFYKDRDGKIFSGPLWDFDLSFGVGGYFNNNQTSGWQYQQTRQPNTTDWFTMLLRDPAFVNELKARWQELRRGPLSNASLQSRIDTLAAPLGNAAQRNFQRWPILTTRNVGPFITPTAATWQGQVQQMRDWMIQRATWLDSTAAWGGPVNPVPTTPPANPTTPPANPTTPPANPTTPPVATTPPRTTPPANGRSCTATYAITSQWQGGFQGDVRVTAGTAAINGWTVTWTFANGQTISQVWNATVTSSGSTVTARNVSFNGSLAAGTSATFGFLGSWTGNNSVPTLSCAAS